MRKLLSLVVLGCVLSMGVGCHKATVAAPVPGQLNSFDAATFRALADVQAAINDFKNSVTSGKVTETPAIKTALNQAISDYNIAEATYKAWRDAGASGPTTPVTAALTKAQSDVAHLGGQ